MTPTDPSPLDAHLGFWLRFVSNHMSHVFSQKVEAHGVTVAEWVVLRRLLALGAAPSSALAEAMGLTRGAVSKLVGRPLVKKLVSRTAGKDDKRFQSVAPTAAGRKLVPTLAALADQNDAAFFGHLSNERQSALAGLVKGIVRLGGLKDVPVE